MQDRSTARTKGPGAITGVRTKIQRFTGNDSETAVAPETFWFYAKKDVSLNGEDVVVPAFKWTKITGWRHAAKVRDVARQRGIQFVELENENPPGEK